MVGPSAASARMSSGVVAGPPPGVKEGRDGRSAGSGIPPSLPVLCPETECGQDQTVAEACQSPLELINAHRWGPGVGPRATAR